MPTPGYQAFISYAHSDSVQAAQLQRKLEQFRVVENGKKTWPLRPVFLDRSELASSPSLSESIREALRNSAALIVVCSIEAAASRWVNEEILYFKRLGNKAIFPIVIAGDPGSDVSGIACFPPGLRYELGPDGEISDKLAEPLAADARHGRDGKDAYLKLIAGLLEVPYDKLKLRQQHKRIRQISTVATGSTAMLLLTLYLAFTALAAQKDAENKRDQAESLIGFMLGDLRDRLEPVGRLDVLDGVGEQALRYFSSLKSDELTSDALLARATALRQIGEVRVAQGRIEDGLIAFNEALVILNNSGSEKKTQRLFELGQINYWIADAHFRELQLNEAQVHIETYLSISRELVALEPENPDFRIELIYAESNLGTLAFRANEMDTARVHFESVVAMIRALSSSQQSYELDVELANAISWLGGIEASIGNLSAAVNWYAEEVDLYRSLIGASEDPERKYDLARALWLLGKTRQEAGQQDLAALDESIQLCRELVAYDPLNFEWRRGLAWSLVLRSRFGLTSRSVLAEETRAMIMLASEALAQISREDSVETERVSAAILVEQARIELMSGSAGLALELSAQARQQLFPKIGGSDRIRILTTYASAVYLGSEALFVAGDPLAAQRLAAASLDQLKITDNDPVELRAFGALLAYLAQRPESTSWRSQIAKTEYRAPFYVLNTDAGAWWHDGMIQGATR